MNLNVLPSNVMLAQSWRWLNTPEIRADLAEHLLGTALLGQVEKAHDWLAEQSERRRQFEIILQQLTERMADHDGIHDRMARAIFGVLDGIIQGTQDPELAAICIRLQQALFPEGPGIVSRSYLYEAGAIEALQRRMTPDMLAQLAAIQLGKETLADWYRVWVEAGQNLGRCVQERDHLLKSTGRGGTGAAAIGMREARSRWISTVQAFLSGLALLELSDQTRERILSALEVSVTQALRGRTGEPGDTPDGDIDDGDGGGSDPVVSDPGEPGDGDVVGEDGSTVPVGEDGDGSAPPAGGGDTGAVPVSA